MSTDNSIFEDVRRDIYEIISHCQQKSLIEENAELDSVLYICSDEVMEQVKEQEKRLVMEYGHDEFLYKSFGINAILKYINRDIPTHYYKLYKKETWEQINDQKKVFDRLDGVFLRWKNVMKSKVNAQLKKNNVDEHTIANVNADIKEEIIEAEKKLNYIKENFDELDVRISNYANRNQYTAVTIAKPKEGKPEIDKFAQITLRKEIPNLLWYVPKSKEDKLTKLQKYFKKAKHAFGTVYYAEI